MVLVKRHGALLDLSAIWQVIYQKTGGLQAQTIPEWDIIASFVFKQACEELMSELAGEPLPMEDEQGHNAQLRRLLERTVGPGQVQWEVVYEAAGMAQAQIYVGRLMAEGIPANAWQEGAGSVFAVTVGLLGTAHVLVPQEFAEQARRILGSEEDEEE
jgi:hypothetical protein